MLHGTLEASSKQSYSNVWSYSLQLSEVEANQVLQEAFTWRWLLIPAVSPSEVQAYRLGLNC